MENNKMEPLYPGKAYKRDYTKSKILLTYIYQ